VTDPATIIDLTVRDIRRAAQRALGAHSAVEWATVCRERGIDPITPGATDGPGTSVAALVADGGALGRVLARSCHIRRASSMQLRLLDRPAPCPASCPGVCA